ncbi:CDP-diacylglycerol--glycerol-3-phosphate 3-phosphatidyltransferase [bacterium]|nr:CDP-diacylglycerol--glycerol-3-phosphate 3-phosphatidyltransferase [bacterium]
MNLPNKLTLSRLLAVVVITILYFVFGNVTWNLFVIFSLFVLASITDYFDGKIARKNNMVTGFGKLADPLADKMLVITVLIILIDMGIIPYLWMLIIVVFRELMVSGVRLVVLEANSESEVSADILGKAKTMTQMVSISLLLLYSAIITITNNDFLHVMYIISIVLFYISMVLLVVSGIEILIKNRKNIKLK